jgi:PBP1b-binding outer membrane lipoprotein LpoB
MKRLLCLLALSLLLLTGCVEPAPKLTGDNEISATVWN